MNAHIRIPADAMFSQFYAVLKKTGFDHDKAYGCALIFQNNSLDGVYTHGVNRFARFIRMVKAGIVKPEAEAVPEVQGTAVERWNGHGGPGPLNALASTKQAMHLADQYGVGCVALRHTNHWMRGGTYGWEAATQGYAFVGWSNTMVTMPAWGGTDPKLGNNPLVISVPYGETAVVLDMAMSQFSIGALNRYQLEGKNLPVPGGYDYAGELTCDPAKVMDTRRVLPAGYWKGSGLSLLLDLLGVFLSDGLSVADVARQGEEHNLSQVFMCFKPHANRSATITDRIKAILDDLHKSLPVHEKEAVLYPGERVVHTRQDNLARGIPVIASVWEEILQL